MKQNDHFSPQMHQNKPKHTTMTEIYWNVNWKIISCHFGLARGPISVWQEVGTKTFQKFMLKFIIMIARFYFHDWDHLRKCAAPLLCQFMLIISTYYRERKLRGGVLTPIHQLLLGTNNSSFVTTMGSADDLNPEDLLTNDKAIFCSWKIWIVVWSSLTSCLYVWFSCLIYLLYRKKKKNRKEKDMR